MVMIRMVDLIVQPRLRALSFAITPRSMLSALLGENMPTSTSAMSSAVSVGLKRSPSSRCLSWAFSSCQFNRTADVPPMTVLG